MLACFQGKPIKHQTSAMSEPVRQPHTYQYGGDFCWGGPLVSTIWVGIHVHQPLLMWFPIKIQRHTRHARHASRPFCPPSNSSRTHVPFPNQKAWLCSGPKSGECQRPQDQGARLGPARNPQSGWVVQLQLYEGPKAGE